MERVTVLCGGRSAEHEVSISSARTVITGLLDAGYRVQVLGIDKKGNSFRPADIRDRLKLKENDSLVYPETASWIHWLSDPENKPSLVFPVLHGPYGEDGTVQGLLELLDLPYVGAGVTGSAVSMNKIHSKEILRANGLPVLPWVSFSRASYDDGIDPANLAEEALEYPVFVKPANMGSSVGISKASSRQELLTGVREAFRYDSRILIEQGIDAREIEVSVMGSEPPEVSVAGEIIPGDEFYSYEAKYLSDRSRLIIPAPLGEDLGREISRLASQAFTCLQLEGMARMDFLVERESGTAWINEPNTIPGFTRISMYPKLWEASGIGLVKLLRRLVELALERKVAKSRLEVDR